MNDHSSFYLENHKSSGFKVGDKVRLVRIPKTFELGWDCSVGEDHGREFVGQTFEIENNYDVHGFCLKGTENLFPYFVLELIEEASQAEIINHCANIVDCYIHDRDILVDDLLKLETLLNKELDIRQE